MWGKGTSFGSISCIETRHKSPLLQFPILWKKISVDICLRVTLSNPINAIFSLITQPCALEIQYVLCCPLQLASNVLLECFIADLSLSCKTAPPWMYICKGSDTKSSQWPESPDLVQIFSCTNLFLEPRVMLSAPKYFCNVCMGRIYRQWIALFSPQLFLCWKQW